LMTAKNSRKLSGDFNENHFSGQTEKSSFSIVPNTKKY